MANRFRRTYFATSNAAPAPTPTATTDQYLTQLLKMKMSYKLRRIAVMSYTQGDLAYAPGKCVCVCVCVWVCNTKQLHPGQRPFDATRMFTVSRIDVDMEAPIVDLRADALTVKLPFALQKTRTLVVDIVKGILLIIYFHLFLLFCSDTSANLFSDTKSLRPVFVPQFNDSNG
jgi:hypothetical protein